MKTYKIHETITHKVTMWPYWPDTWIIEVFEKWTIVKFTDLTPYGRRYIWSLDAFYSWLNKH